MVDRALLMSVAAWALACGSEQSARSNPTAVALPPSQGPREDPESPPRVSNAPPGPDALKQAHAFLGEIGRSAQMAFQREDKGPKGRYVTGMLCPSSKPVPTALSSLAPSYHSTEADWLDDPGWRCLKLSVEEPLLCQISYESDAKSFTATARCPGSGMLRELRLKGSVVGSSLQLSDQIEETDVAH